MIKKDTTNTLEVYLDEIIYDSDVGQIQGWAVDKSAMALPKIEMANVKEITTFKPVIREDILEKYQLGGKEIKLGFKLNFIKGNDTPVLNLISQDGKTLSVKIKKRKVLKEDISLTKDALRQIGLKNFFKNYKDWKYVSWRGYNNWYLKKISEINREEIEQEASGFDYRPLISIVMPVYNVDTRILKSALDSVINQTYPDWELCIADDNSSDPNVRKVLEQYESRDPRIKLIFRRENGHIAEATNTALTMAEGDFIAFMDDDDLISPVAFHEFVKEINKNPDADLLYCDEDYINAYDFHLYPFLKPDFNKRLFLGHNCVTHFVIVKRELVDKVIGFRTSTNGAQDYDFLLRILDNTENFVHIDGILYNWRMMLHSVSGNPEAKKYAYDAGQKALQDYMNRNNIPATVHINEDNIGTYYVTSDNQPKVSILMTPDPKDDEMTYKTLGEILKNTDYPNKEFILIDFDLDSLKKRFPDVDFDREDIRLITVRPGSVNEKLQDAVAFNYPKGDYLLIIKAGVLPQGDKWLDRLVDETVFENTGLITPLYLTEEDEVLSAGYYYDSPSLDVVYPSRMSRRRGYDYFFRFNLPQYVEANFGLCYLIGKEDFKKLKNLDKYTEPLAGLDLADQIRSLGKEIVMTPRSTSKWAGRRGEFFEAVPPLQMGYKVLPEENYEYYSKYKEPEKSYSNDLIKRLRRRTNGEYRGRKEDTYV